MLILTQLSSGGGDLGGCCLWTICVCVHTRAWGGVVPCKPRPGLPSPLHLTFISIRLAIPGGLEAIADRPRFARLFSEKEPRSLWCAV